MFILWFVVVGTIAVEFAYVLAWCVRRCVNDVNRSSQEPQEALTWRPVTEL